MLTITKQSDYALLFISKLIEKKDYISLSELVKDTKLPQRFLARIAAVLVSHKIVESREGKMGGYQLTANLKKTSLYDFLKIFEKDVAICKCSDDHESCQYSDICLHHHFLEGKLNKILVAQLKKVSLSELFHK